jgi:hypothetical protein
MGYSILCGVSALQLVMIYVIWWYHRREKRQERRDQMFDEQPTRTEDTIHHTASHGDGQVQATSEQPKN